ncbi:MAG TPA: cobalamin-independent methionine synthase II family protein [Dehalococcoidia bacterium]|nr:cobalamin-independent methionine synthase II family protein [Dehalococcoidia bacterium]
MKRSETRILTTHAGSLIRPPEVAEFDSARQEGRPVDEAAYDAALRKAVADVVRKQAEVGIDVVDDGEFSKSSWGTYINSRVSGFRHDPERDMAINYTGKDSERFAEFFESPEGGGRRMRWRGADVCVGPIVYTDKHSIYRDIENLKAAVAAVNVEEAFLPVVAPASAAFNGVNDYYKTEEEYVYALAEALRNEYVAIYESGLVLQVDDAVLANAYDDLMSRGEGVYRKWAQLRVEALNHALRGIPPERVRYHLCYGSWHAPHVADAPLEAIVDLILSVNAGAYSIEAANVRHEHEWRVWEDVKLPEGKILIPGVVTHHTLSVEHPRLVADRIVRYAKIVGRENVIAGTDCGFQQGARIQRVHPTIMWAKLQSLAEGARIASQELWRK